MSAIAILLPLNVLALFIRTYTPVDRIRRSKNSSCLTSIIHVSRSSVLWHRVDVVSNYIRTLTVSILTIG